MAYYDKTASDSLKAKFSDLAKPTGADFSSLIDYIDAGLKAIDNQTSTTTTTIAPTTTTTSTTTSK